MPIIDIYRHCVPPSFPKQSNPLVRSTLRLIAGMREVPTYSSVTVKGITSILYADLLDIDVQIKRRDEAGVTKGLLSFSMLLETVS